MGTSSPIALSCSKMLVSWAGWHDQCLALSPRSFCPRQNQSWHFDATHSPALGFPSLRSWWSAEPDKLRLKCIAADWTSNSSIPVQTQLPARCWSNQLLYNALSNKLYHSNAILKNTACRVCLNYQETWKKRQFSLCINNNQSTLLQQSSFWQVLPATRSCSRVDKCQLSTP